MVKRCPVCQGGMEGMRPHAVYCSRRCKGKASSRRAVLDGRAKIKDHARYERESKRRREQAKANYWKDPELARAQSAAWRKANPEARRIQGQRRRARKLGADVSHISERDWKRMLARADGICCYCSKPGKLVMDHIIPLARGGRHSIGNVAPVCVPCNSSKSARLFSDWRYRK